ncbi:unnamed protein product, partial [Discosporangium mesarthrocarpum]
STATAPGELEHVNLTRATMPQRRRPRKPMRVAKPSPMLPPEPSWGGPPESAQKGTLGGPELPPKPVAAVGVLPERLWKLSPDTALLHKGQQVPPPPAGLPEQEPPEPPLEPVAAGLPSAPGRAESPFELRGGQAGPPKLPEEAPPKLPEKVVVPELPAGQASPELPVQEPPKLPWAPPADKPGKEPPKELPRELATRLPGVERPELPSMPMPLMHNMNEMGSDVIRGAGTARSTAEAG